MRIETDFPYLRHTNFKLIPESVHEATLIKSLYTQTLSSFWLDNSDGSVTVSFARAEPEVPTGRFNAGTASTPLKPVRKRKSKSKR